MKQFLLIFCVFLFIFSSATFAQIPTATLVQIARSEDELRYDKTVESLMKNAGAKIRARAALAAGRIGKEAAIPALVNLLENDADTQVRAAAAFALGEIESLQAADAILKILGDTRINSEIRARAIEAAGKIAAANAKDEKAKALSDGILQTLEIEDKKRSAPNYNIISLGLTAALRARPANSEKMVVEFTRGYTPEIRADALNTLARLRAKTANENARELLQKDEDAVVRANAARLLGAAEDKEAFEVLLNAAMTDSDSRVRVSAIRSLASLKDARAADRLLQRGDKLLADYKKSKFANPFEKNELLEIATTLGRILSNTNNEKAVSFLQNFREADKFTSPETEIAFARIAPEKYVNEFKLKNSGYADWRVASAYAQGFGELAALENTQLKLRAAQTLTSYVGSMAKNVKPAYQAQMTKAMPDLMRGIAAFKPDNLDAILRNMLNNPDVFIRATAAELLGEQPTLTVNVEALKTAFAKALLTDKKINDAQLAILDALAKLDKSASVGVFLLALNAPDYLVRKKAFQLLEDKELKKEFPGINTALEVTNEEKKDRVLPYTPVFGTKLGMILNTNADYTRAVSRVNGQTKAVLTTEKGTFTINLLPEDAPLTVDNFVKLARAGYFNGLTVHRVVPNFVMQDGDPRGDGNGGPGWEIRDEINTVPYERGAVGMALSGKNTGGSQWFVTHSPQPHLDGGYTVFGRVNESDMEIVDNIARGDKITSVKIIEGNLPRKDARGRKK